MLRLLETKGIIPLAMALLVIAMMGQQSLGWSSLATQGLLLVSIALMIGSILAKKRKSERI